MVSIRGSTVLTHRILETSGLKGVSWAWEMLPLRNALRSISILNLCIKQTFNFLFFNINIVFSQQSFSNMAPGRAGMRTLSCLCNPHHLIA